MAPSRTYRLTLLLILLTGLSSPVNGQESLPVEISGQMFLAYQSRQQNGLRSNDFSLKRGYLTIERQFNPVLGVRFTQDITLDREGTDAGDIEMRLKYLYLHINLNQVSWLKNAWIEAGMVSRPWISFEEKINRYRVQGPHFVESMGIITSADFGVSFFSLLGGKLNDEQLGRYRYSYPGRYGSFSIGIYNGGGYFANEKNRNKTIESRLTLRPLPDYLPGLQISYHFVNGKGNLPEGPIFRLNQAALSFESRRLILMAQATSGTGNMAGSFLDLDQQSLPHRGFSIFGELFLYQNILSMFGEYRYFELNSDNPGITTKWVAGISCHFLSSQKILIDYEHLTTPSGLRRMVEIAMEIRF